MSSKDVQLEITEAFQAAEESFRKDYPFAWLASLIGPFVVTAAILVLTGLFHSWNLAGGILMAAAVTFVLFGRFVILFGNDSATGTEDVEGVELVDFLSSGQLFLMVTYMDFMTALFVAFHMGVLFRLPWIGPKISGLVADAQFILKAQPWMEKATFVSLVLFVIFPSSTTGSIGGSIFGRLVGLKRARTLGAIFIGSILGNGIMYLFSAQLEPLKETIQDSTPAKVISVLVVIAVIVAFERWFRWMKKKYVEEQVL